MPHPRLHIEIPARGTPAACTCTSFPRVRIEIPGRGHPRGVAYLHVTSARAN